RPPVPACSAWRRPTSGFAPQSATTASSGRPLTPPLLLIRSMAIIDPTSAVFPPAAATPLSGWSTPILYGLAWPNASRQGAGTRMVAPTAPAAVADRLRNRRRVVLPLHHKSLAQSSF